MFLNENEEKVILKFYNNLSKIQDTTLTLIWDSGSISATFDTCFEDLDDESGDEFYSFAFIAKEVHGTPPVDVLDNNFFLINYKNFPLQIYHKELLMN